MPKCLTAKKLGLKIPIARGLKLKSLLEMVGIKKSIGNSLMTKSKTLENLKTTNHRYNLTEKISQQKNYRQIPTVEDRTIKRTKLTGEL